MLVPRFIVIPGSIRQSQGWLLRLRSGGLWGDPADRLAAEVHSGNLANNLHTRECFCTGPDSKAVLYQRHTIGIPNAYFILYLVEKGGSL